MHSRRARTLLLLGPLARLAADAVPVPRAALACLLEALPR